MRSIFWERVTRIDRSVRLGSLAGVPALWLAMAWGDAWFLVAAVFSAVAAVWALRALDRRRGDEDDSLLL
jgi:hypothetical protein